MKYIDRMNRIVKETNQLHHATETACDLAGNLLSDGDSTYTYDRRGNL